MLKQYFLKASRELKDATKEINEMSNFVVHILEQSDYKHWEIKRDDQGKIVGLNITLTVSEGVHLQDSSSVTLIEQLQNDIN